MTIHLERDYPQGTLQLKEFDLPEGKPAVQYSLPFAIILKWRENGEEERLSQCLDLGIGTMSFRALERHFDSVDALNKRTKPLPMDKPEAIEEMTHAVDRITAMAGRDVAFAALMTAYGTTWAALENEGRERDALQRVADTNARAGFASGFQAIRFRSYRR